MKSLLYLTVCIGVCVGSQLRFENHCLWSVWPRLVGDEGKGNPGNGSFEVPVGTWVDIDIPLGWSGHIWGRTHCTDHIYDKCQTGTPDTTPATVAHFNLSGIRGHIDYYYLDVVDGFNLPLRIAPIAMTHMKVNETTMCDWNGCYYNINDYCPDELKVMSGDQIVSCLSACTRFKTNEYCCKDEVVVKDHKCDTSKWPKDYPTKLFHRYCPTAYSVDPELDIITTGKYSCGGNPQTGFEFMFCPGPN